MLTDPEPALEEFSSVFALPVPAYSGRAVSVAAGTTIRITDVLGHQIGDMFAFVRDRPTEWLSVGATRTAHTRLFPEIGGAFMTQFLRPILTYVADTSPGVHDMLYPPCSPAQYKLAGVAGHHPSCRENFEIAAVSAGMPIEPVPEPVNLFQNTPPDATGELIIGPAASAPGDFVLLRAEMDLVLILTACSYDLGNANGEACTDLLIELDTKPLGVGVIDD
jgi:uncharacterized protein YcgI (DUF1989 family)